MTSFRAAWMGGLTPERRQWQLAERLGTAQHSKAASDVMAQLFLMDDNKYEFIS